MYIILFTYLKHTKSKFICLSFTTSAYINFHTTKNRKRRIGFDHKKNPPFIIIQNKFFFIFLYSIRYTWRLTLK